MEQSRLRISKQDTERIPKVKGNPEAYCISINRLIDLDFKVYMSDGHGYYIVMNIAPVNDKLMQVCMVKEGYIVCNHVSWEHPLFVRFKL